MFEMKPTIPYVKLKQVETQLAESTSRLNDLSYTPHQFLLSGETIINDVVLQRAIDQSTLDNATLNLGRETYTINNTIRITCNLNGENATFVINPAVAVGVIVGFESTTDLLRNKFIQLPKVIRNTKDWTSGIGILISNALESNIRGSLVKNFKIGVKVGAFSTGTVYNTIDFQYLMDNETQILLSPINTGGWVNENVVTLLRMGYSGTTGTPVTGTKFISMYSDNYGVNNNVFMKPCLEGDGEYTIHILNGGYNTFISPRFEGNSPKVKIGVANSKVSVGNTILYGYKSENITFELDAGCNYNNAFTPRQTAIQGSDSTSALKLANTAGGEAGAWTVYNSGVNPLTADSTKYTVKSTQYALHVKQETDLFDRFKITNAGYIYFGDGTAAPTKYLRNFGTEIKFGGGNLSGTGTWDTDHVKFGAYHLWFDSFGKPRIKSSAPTSDTDGSALNIGLSGTTAQRPTTGVYVGMPYFDTTLGKPIWCKSTGTIVWVDSTGTTV